jgi:hypothetical protein
MEKFVYKPSDFEGKQIFLISGEEEINVTNIITSVVVSFPPIDTDFINVFSANLMNGKTIQGKHLVIRDKSS